MSQPSRTAKHRQTETLNEELENYFANTIIPQLFVDANLILRKFTPPAMKQFTLTLDDIGKSVTNIIDNIRYPTLIQNIEEVIATGTTLEKEVQTLDLRWFQMNIIPYKVLKENKTNGVIVTFVDITNRIKALQDLEKLNADNSIFLYSFSHDIKQPLSVLTLLPYAMEDAFEERNREEFSNNIDKLTRSVESMKKIIDELTTLIKVNDEPADGERVNIENICEDVLLTLKDEIYNHGIDIKTEFHTSEIFFSRKNLRSIVFNLLNNSIKYRNTERPLQVLIRTEKIDEYIRLSIADNGLGINSRFHEMIFKRYSRVNTNVEGAGLGLYIIRTMVENHGGKIEVQSEEGEGATFNVYFK